MGEIAVNILEPKLAPAMVLAQGGDYSSYSRRYDLAVEKAFTEAAHKQQREAEEGRLALIKENYTRLRAEELSWNPVQPGVTTTCISCGAEVHIYGSWRDGFDDTDPREPHLFRESVEGHAILTTRCAGCNSSLALDLGRLAPSAPRNFTSLSSLTKTFGIASGEAPISAEGEKRPSLRERLLGASH
jgi:hypothetical protein